MSTAQAQHLSQGGQDLKGIVMRAARAAFAEAEIPFRQGRMARLIGTAIARGDDLEALIRDELDSTARRIETPALRNALGILDPTGQTAAARADATMPDDNEKAPAGVGTMCRGNHGQLGG